MTEFYNTIEKAEPFRDKAEPFSDEEFAEFDATMADISKAKRIKPRRDISDFNERAQAFLENHRGTFYDTFDLMDAAGYPSPKNKSSASTFRRRLNEMADRREIKRRKIGQYVKYAAAPEAKPESEPISDFIRDFDEDPSPTALFNMTFYPDHVEMPLPDAMALIKALIGDSDE